MTTTVDTTTNVTSWGSGDSDTSVFADIIVNGTTDFLWTNIASTVFAEETTSQEETGLETTVSLTTSKSTSISTTAALIYKSSSTVIPSSTQNNGTQNIAGALLLVITFLALVGNVAVVIALRHKCYKSRALYTFLNNLAITAVCDCVFNAPLIAASMLSNGTVWLDLSFLCVVNSFVFNLIHTQIIMCLLILVLDRIFSLKYSDSYIGNFIGVKANLFAGYTWIHCTAFNLAIIVTSVESSYFEFRYFCSVLYENNLVFNILITLLCVIAPWIAILCSYIYIVRLAWETNARDSGLVQAGYDELAELRGTGKELNHAKPVGVLVVLWCLLIGPYQLIHMIYVYSGRSSGSEILWVVCTGLKFIYDFLVSVVILTAWPETWKEIRNVFSGRPDNAIESALRDHVRIPGVRSSWADGSDGSVTDRSTLDRSTISRSFPIPVLFATSNGLQLQVGARGRSNDGEMEAADLATENQSDPYKRGFRPPPPYLPPLFSVVHSSEEDSFNTNSSLPLKDDEGEAMELNESADRKSAATQFQLSLGKGDDFKTLKSLSPSTEASDMDVTEPHITNSKDYQIPQNESARKADYVLDDKQKPDPINDKDDQTRTHEQVPKIPKRETEVSRTKRPSKTATDISPRATVAKEQSQPKSERERTRKPSGPTKSSASNRNNGTANGGGRVGGDGGKGGGGGERNRDEKRQRNPSGKSTKSEKPSSRNNNATKKNGDAAKSM
ncbi:uncharacterized protein [Diadema antillarum]|uniref:uncharacterized protein n=1 Tax=Diadema antillarum TaxID=105358 RepID=UPI003A86DBA6